MGSLLVRVGKLIENYVVNKYNLFYNTRQHKSHKGFYDAYKEDKLYEIKAIKVDKNAKVVLIKNNHKQLIEQKGEYIFIVYELSNKDSDLQLITDIKIQKEIILSAKIVDNLISGEWKRKNSNKTYCRVLLSKILSYDTI